MSVGPPGSRTETHAVVINQLLIDLEMMMISYGISSVVDQKGTAIFKHDSRKIIQGLGLQTGK